LHRGRETGAACLSCHLKLQTYPGIRGCLLDSTCSPALKMRTSADSWQPEGASLESCRSASSAHGTARTEAQTLGLLASLATSNFKCSLGMGSGGACQTPLAALLRSCESRQIAGSQKGLDWKAVAHPHVPMALLAQSHRHWGCLLVLPPQTSNIAWDWGAACQTSLAALLRSCERLQIAGSQKGLAWNAVAQPYLPMALLAQSHRHWGCLLVLPPETSNVALEWGVGVPARLHLQPCFEDANICK